jgi:hypothetical protein
MRNGQSVLASAKDETFTKAYLLNRTATYLLKLGQWTEAERLYSQAAKIHMMVNGPEHEHTLSSMHKLVLAYAQGGKRVKAAQLLEEIWKTGKTVLGLERPQTLASMGMLTIVHRDLG